MTQHTLTPNLVKIDPVDSEKKFGQIHTQTDNKTLPRGNGGKMQLPALVVARSGILSPSLWQKEKNSHLMNEGSSAILLPGY